MLDGRFRFDNFIVGASNRLAVSAARAVAETPGVVYNPLVIYSASGLGKTHLLAALGHATRELHPERDVEYLTLERFVDELHAAVASGHADAQLRRYQRVQMLLLDDVQFLTGRVETQTEMLRIFNAVQENGGQIVMTSDRPPSEIADVDARLLSRMSGGLIVDIGEPEYETRVAILRHKCAERGLAFAPGVLEQLASAPAGNVRELQGALNRVAAQQSISDAPLGIQDVRVALAGRSEDETDDEYQSFLNEVAAAVSLTVDPWRVRLGEMVSRWSGEGFQTTMLERAMAASDAPDVEALEARFAAAATRLRALEAEAARLDTKLIELAAFRDPERVADAETVVLRALAAYDPPPGPDRRFSIEQFVVGERNRLALRGAAEVIALPGARYNPLYIHGATSAGKTHLLHAIGNALAARDGGGWTVACVTAQQFTDGLIEAIQEAELERWRMRYRAVDALLIDDAQALSGKERSQEELFHLFNAFHDRGKQIVLAADVAPSQLVELAARLRSRFEGGLVVELGRVSRAERVARYTPVPIGAEAAAPTIDAWFEEAVESPPDALASQLESLGGVDFFFLDPEKCITEWPGVDGRIIEDLR